MRHRSHAAGWVALLASLLAVTPASAARVVNTERTVVHGGRHLTQVMHIDDPRYGLAAAAFERSFKGTPALDGPLTDPVQRGAARMLAGPQAAAPGTRDATTVTPETTWCGTVRSTDDVTHERTNLPRYKVIFARPFDAPNRMATYQDEVQNAATWIANKIAASAGGLRAPRFDYGTSCGPGFLDVTQVALAHSQAYYDGLAGDFSARATAVHDDIEAAIPGMQLSGGRWNYLVLADGVSPTSDPRSVGYLYLDDTPGPSNANDLGGNMALVLGSGGTDFVGNSQDYLAYSVTHEVGHTLGAVQNTAPHSTGAGHCTNGYAIMCYDDGGPAGSSYTTSACSGASSSSYANAFQCGGDDYVAAVPALGSYLSTHWNTFTSSFMCEVGSCLASTFAPAAVLQASASHVPAGGTVTLDGSGSSDRAGSITGYEWDLDGDGIYERNTGTSPTTALTVARQGSRHVALRVTNDSGLTAAAGATVTFDGSAPVAVLNAPATAVAGQEVVLDAGGSSDPDAGDTLSFAWDTGFGVFQAPNATVLRFVPTRVGDLAVRVRVMDSTGAFSVAATTISVTAPAVAAAAAVPAPVAKTSTLAHALAARFVSLRVTRAGTTLVVVECPKTSPGCRGRGTVAVGKRTRSLDYALASGKRKTLAIRSPVRLHGRRARAAKLRLADEAGLTVTRSFTLRKR